jgi:hypothetical protein
MAEEEKVPEIDVLEFAPEKDILLEFGGEWQDKVKEEKKWQDRKAKLDELGNACANVKIKPGSNEGMAAFLKGEAGNSNINIAMGAIAASTAIVKGMGKDFGVGIKILVGPVFLKYKEKRPMVQDLVNKFAEAVTKAVNMEFVAEEIIPLITNVAPGVKLGTIKYVEQAAIVNYIDVLQRIERDLMPVMVKAIEDKDGAVREAALHCMGILKGRYGESVAAKYLDKVNQQKLEKINEASKEVKPSKYDRPENYKPPAPKKEKKVEKKPEKGDDEFTMDFTSEAPPKRKPPNIGKAPPKRVKKAEDVEMKNEEEEKKPSPAPIIESTPPVERPKTAAPVLGDRPARIPSAPMKDDDENKEGLSKEDAIAKVEEVFSSATVKKFEDAKW